MKNSLLYENSTIASVHPSSSMMSHILGGTIKMGVRNTFGLEATTVFTLVSVESITIVLKLMLPVIVILSFQQH